MELLAGGQTAEVFAWGDGRVLKLDRPDWNGLSHYEAGVLARIVDAGGSAPQVFETVTVDGRAGVVLERLDGIVLEDRIRDEASDDGRAALVDDFVRLHAGINAMALDGLPDLVTRTHGELDRSGLERALVDELHGLLDELDEHGGHDRVLCHYDFHPGNVIVTAGGPVVIDWLTASTGPALADFARTIVLLSGAVADPSRSLGIRDAVLAAGTALRGADPADVQSWVRIAAAARLAEGFGGAYAAHLAAIAAAA